MKTVSTYFIVASFIGINFLTPSFAQEVNHIKWSQLTKKLEDEGYKIRELDQNLEGWSAEVIDSQNTRFDLRIDRQGKITHKKIDN